MGAVTSRTRHLRLTVGLSAIVALVGTVVGLLAAGSVGALGVFAGVALVTVSYVASTLAIAWADSVNPRLVMGVGMGMYITKFSLFGFLLVAINGSEWAGKIPMAVGIVAGVVAWTAAQIWWTVHYAHPHVRTE